MSKGHNSSCNAAVKHIVPVVSVAVIISGYRSLRLLLSYWGCSASQMSDDPPSQGICIMLQLNERTFKRASISNPLPCRFRNPKQCLSSLSLANSYNSYPFSDHRIPSRSNTAWNCIDCSDLARRADGKLIVEAGIKFTVKVACFQFQLS